MPKLRHPKSGQELRLSAETSIGRSRACVLRLEDPRVSGMHAMLAWKGQGWELRDLGSRNGTYVGGRRLESGARELLTRGAQLAFGSPESPWVLVDDRAPVLAASSGELWIEADGRYRDDLVSGLRIPDNQFNVAIFRARQHLKRAGVLNAQALVERRTGSGQLRFGCPRFEIRRP